VVKGAASSALLACSGSRLQCVLLLWILGARPCSVFSSVRLFAQKAHLARTSSDLATPRPRAHLALLKPLCDAL
jgi:hypothetical protein